MNQIIIEARSWIGTKFKHQGRVKINSNDQGGCDCLGLIMGVGIKTKTQELLKNYDTNDYPRRIKSNILLEELNQLMLPSEKVSTGNILLIRIGEWPVHLALVSGVVPYLSIIHSYAQARKVVEQHLPEDWQKNIVQIYENFS